MMFKITTFTILVFLLSCQPASQSARRKVVVADSEKDPGKMYNLMNEELPPKELEEKTRTKYEADLAAAKNALEANPDSLNLIIWHGRRLAYLGRYLEAIQVYSEGLKLYPGSYRLRRHRGHRYITTRQFNKAIDDFELAAYYALNAKNSIEADGLPNKLNKPLSNDKFNIWYHFGLSYYLSGRFDKALSAYNKCQEYSDNSDLKVATSYWQYLTLKKLGNVEMAEKILISFSREMNLIENETYLDLLLLYGKKRNPEKLMKKATNKDGFIDPTLAYGIGCYYQHQGKFEKANEIFLKILESPQWDAFGYIAAEAELTTIFPVP